MRNAMHRNTTAQPTAIGLQYLADLPSTANIEFGSFSQFPSWDLGPLGHLALVPWQTCLSRSVATWSYLQYSILQHPFAICKMYSAQPKLSPFCNFSGHALKHFAQIITIKNLLPHQQDPTTQQRWFKKTLEILQCPLKLCLQGRLTQNSPRIWSYHKANFPKQIKCKTGWNNSAPNKARQFLIKWQTLCLKYNVDATKIHVVWRCLVYTLYHSMVR